MKKVIIGVAAVGAIFVLRTAAGRGGQKLREHCKEMAGKCQQMMAGQSGPKREDAATPEHIPETPQFVADGEAVTA